MHIGIDATALYGRYNGVEYALWNGLRALAALESKHFFSVWVPGDGPAPAEVAGFGPRWRWHRLSFAGGNKARRIVWQQGVLPRTLKSEACDVLYAPTYVSPLRSPVPVVLTVYDLIALDSPEYATRGNRLHYGAVLPAAMRRAARVIVPTPAVAQAVARFAGDNVRTIPPGIEPEFHPADEAAEKAIRDRYALPPEYLLFVGNREPKKNLPRLLAALKELAACHQLPPLVLVGEARAWGDALEVPAGIEVVRLGYVPREDLPALMSGCLAFLFPSLAEGFGLPVMEAFACGAPVVASTAVPIPDLGEAAALCDPLSVESIAAAIERVLTDTALRANLSQRAFQFASSYTSRGAAMRTLEVLREAAGGTRPFDSATPSQALDHS